VFQVGEIVTRGGDDRQRVLEVDEDGFCITVQCIRAPASGWCQVGEVERNLARRYSYPEIEGEARRLDAVPLLK
jgi:hypothetical protein